MGIDWGGPFDRSIGFGVFTNMQWCILLGALRIRSGNSQPEGLEFLEDLEGFEDIGDRSDERMGQLLQTLPVGDPIRPFLRQGEEGKLSAKECAALATRLAEVVYFLTVKRREQEQVIFAPHLTKTRQFQDLQLNQIALFLRDFAAAAEQGVEISWG